MFILSPRQASRAQRSRLLAQTSLNAMHPAGAQQLFVCHKRGSRKERRGHELGQKEKPILHPRVSQAPWLLPKARPSSALGNKYLYGDNYSIWEENPIKQEPCRAANAGTELEAATLPNTRLLPIMQELPGPTARQPAPKEHCPPPAGNFEQPGPPRASPQPAKGDQGRWSVLVCCPQLLGSRGCLVREEKGHHSETQH